MEYDPNFWIFPMFGRPKEGRFVEVSEKLLDFCRKHDITIPPDQKPQIPLARPINDVRGTNSKTDMSLYEIWQILNPTREGIARVN